MADLVIVNMQTLAYHLVRPEETPEKALQRVQGDYKDKIKHLKRLYLRYNNSPVWAKRIEEVQKELDAGFKVMKFEEYQELKGEK